LRAAATKAHNTANVSHATCPPPTGYVPCEQNAALRAVRCDGVGSDARLLAHSFAQVVVHVPVVFRASGIALLFLFCESLSTAHLAFTAYVCGWASEREECIIASIHSCTSVPMCARVRTRTRRRASRLATHTCSCVSFADVSAHNSAASSCQQCSSIAHGLTALHRFSIADHYTCPSRCNGGCGGYWFHAAIHGRGHSRDAATRRCSGWGLNM
jgi:hypothetical protein